MIAEGATNRRTWRITGSADEVTIRTWSSAAQWTQVALIGVLPLLACALLWPLMSDSPDAVGPLVLVCTAVVTALMGPTLAFVALGREEAIVTATTVRVTSSEVVRSTLRVTEIAHDPTVRVLPRTWDVRGCRLEIASAAQTVRLGAWMPDAAAHAAAAGIRRVLVTDPPPANTDGVVRPVAPDRAENGDRLVAEPVLVPDALAPADGLRWVEGESGRPSIGTFGAWWMTRLAFAALVALIAAGAGAVYAATALGVSLLLLVAPGGIVDARRRRRLRALVRRFPDEPWLWTDAWVSPIAAARGGVHRADGTNVDRLSLPAPASSPSGRLTLKFISGDAPLTGELTFTLRRLAALKRNDEGERRVALTHVGRAVVRARRPAEATPVTFAFAVPADGTRLGARDAAIWQLVVECRTADGRDVTTAFPLPLFGAASELEQNAVHRQRAR